MCGKTYVLHTLFLNLLCLYKTIIKRFKNNLRKFSTMDILVPISMKNAAKCDMQCELQNSVSHQIFERIPR